MQIIRAYYSGASVYPGGIDVKVCFGNCGSDGYDAAIKFARAYTGKMFGIEHYDIIPDGIIMGKSAGASLTLGCFMARSEIIDSLPAPAHLFTMGANALACAAGLAAFDIYYSDEFQELLKKNIAIAENKAAMLRENHPSIVEGHRNLGLSMGIVVKDPDGVSDNDATFRILFRCYELGLIIISVAGNALRIQPPLNIEPELLEKEFGIIDQAMDDYENGRISDEVLKYKAGWQEKLLSVPDHRKPSYNL